MAKAIIKAEAKKRLFMVEKFCELTKLMHEKEAVGEFEIDFQGGTEDRLTIRLVFSDYKDFTIYSFCQLDWIKKGFKVIERYIQTGERMPYHSIVDMRNAQINAQLNDSFNATDTRTKQQVSSAGEPSQAG